MANTRPFTPMPTGRPASRLGEILYAAESLWYAKIHPLELMERLTNARMRALHRGIVSVLRRSITARGTSADAYLDIYGHQGTFVPS